MAKPIHNPFLRTKSLDQVTQDAAGEASGLKRVLTAVDLTAIGVGAVIGAGIFVLTGTAAKEAAGPAIMLSYVFAGIACMLAALCYAEFAARFPISGSIYTYSYVSVGELFAWIIGWDIVLEYTIGAATVAVGWTEYLDKLVTLPPGLLHFPLQTPFGTYPINWAAGLIIGLLTVLLALGIKESSRFNAVMVSLKVGVVLFVILAGLFFINPANWHPFTPFAAAGTPCPTGNFCWEGIFSGAALVFFAYVGFDAVSTTAEEVANPQRDLPIGILASLAICTVLYIAVAAVITGMVPYTQIDPGAPLAAAFGTVGFGFAENLIGIGGVAGLTTVMLVLLLSQPRVFFSMARDGLLPAWFSRVHPRFCTPFNATLATGSVAALVAMFCPIRDLHHMVSVGTLFAFAMICASMLILRYKRHEGDLRGISWVLPLTVGLACLSFNYRLEGEGAATNLWLVGVGALLTLVPTVLFCINKGTNLPTTFRCPAVPWLPILGMGSMIFMMAQLQPEAWYRLIWWLLLGLMIYGAYGIWHSRLGKISSGS